MLKLTNSFYRYLVFTCEKVSKTHVRRFSHLNCDRKTRGKERADVILTAQLHSSLELRQHDHGKKRLKIKIPPLGSSKSKKHNPMSDHLAPTTTHASSGGQFEVSVINLVLLMALILIIFVATHALLSTASNNEEQLLQTDDAAPSGDTASSGATASFCETASLGDTDVFDDTASSGDTESWADYQKRRLNLPRDFRFWETVAGSTGSNNIVQTVQFKVLSYNLLAQHLLESHPSLYTDCSPYDLKWKNRASKLFDEITLMSPDILCLQEVQSSHLETFFSRFERSGYTMIFKKKTGYQCDGCAIFYKNSMFTLIERASVEFFQPDLPILNRDNVGVIVKLVPNEIPSLTLVVATTHLLYNPKRTDVRLAQMQFFLAEIERFAYIDDGGMSGHHPIIMTGDFNSTPDSAVIQLLDNGRVDAGRYRDGSDWRQIGVTDDCQHLSAYLARRNRPQIDMKKLKPFSPEHDQFSTMFNKRVIKYDLDLESVYDKSRIATTFQDGWVTVDYIYFSLCSNISLVERLMLPTPEDCEILGRLPNSMFGSDHLALAAVFELFSFVPPAKRSQ